MLSCSWAVASALAGMAEDGCMIRCRIPELMDAPSLDREAHAHALRTLNRVNRMLGVDRRLYQSMRQLSGSASMSILDLGTGGGGFLGYLAERRHNNADHALVGIDKSQINALL